MGADMAEVNHKAKAENEALSNCVAKYGQHGCGEKLMSAMGKIDPNKNLQAGTLRDPVLPLGIKDQFVNLADLIVTIANAANGAGDRKE